MNDGGRWMWQDSGMKGPYAEDSGDTEMTKVHAWCRTDKENTLTENERDWGNRLGRYMPGSAQEIRERLSQEQDIVEVCCNSREMFQRKCGLHSDWWSGCLDCRWNISVGNNRIYVGTWQADRPWSRLHDGIVTCLIASKTAELFKISECWHWAPKFDISALKWLFSFPFISQSFLLLLWLFWYGSWTAEACIPFSYQMHLVCDSASPKTTTMSSQPQQCLATMTTCPPAQQQCPPCPPASVTMSSMDGASPSPVTMSPVDDTSPSPVTISPCHPAAVTMSPMMMCPPVQWQYPCIPDLSDNIPMSLQSQPHLAATMTHPPSPSALAIPPMNMPCIPSAWWCRLCQMAQNQPHLWRSKQAWHMSGMFMLIESRECSGLCSLLARHGGKTPGLGHLHLSHMDGFHQLSSSWVSHPLILMSLDAVMLYLLESYCDQAALLSTD